MSQFKSIERLSLILNYVYNQHFPSATKIMDYLAENDIETTERTFQRDLKTLRDMCFVDVKYNRMNDGYFVNKESEKDFQDWMHVFRLFNTARVINDVLVKSNNNIDFIDFDRNEQILKTDILGKILSAVVERKKIKFKYQSFWYDEAKTINLYPHLLKQYLNRWYVFGCFPNGDFRSFGLDRIIELEVQTETFRLKNKKPKEFFDSVVGLTYSVGEIETVVLSFEPFQGNYIKSQPIHPTQQILIDDEKELRISIRVRLNYELEEQVLKHGQRVKVIEPKSFKKTIKNRIKEALANYKK